MVSSLSHGVNCNIFLIIKGKVYMSRSDKIKKIAAGIAAATVTVIVILFIVGSKNA
jgi:hypothetical protein